MSDCCCGSKATESEAIPTGWQCPCCLVVYAPTVGACYCCVAYALDPAAPPLDPEPLHPPGPPAASAPWFLTFQSPPTFTAVTLTVEVSHAEG